MYKNSHLEWPRSRLTVNLAPASLRKEGPAYDLPIALGVLAASEQIPLGALDGAMVVAELSLDGSVRHARVHCQVDDARARHGWARAS